LEAIARLRVKSVTLDGEGVVCGADGVTDFDKLRAAVGRLLYARNWLHIDAVSPGEIEEVTVAEQPDKLKAQAEEYEKLADAAVDPEEKKRLQALARKARDLAMPESEP